MICRNVLKTISIGLVEQHEQGPKAKHSTWYPQQTEANGMPLIDYLIQALKGKELNGLIETTLASKEREKKTPVHFKKR